MNRLVKRLDKNVEAMLKLALCYLFQLGLKQGLFEMTTAPTTLEELLSKVRTPNGGYLKRLIETYVKLGILSMEGEKLVLEDFSYEFNILKDDVRELRPEWVEALEELYKMAGYAFISREHPKILMDFDKGADFWDMRLLMEPYRTGRELAIELLGLEDGIDVVDLGCGSVSPVEVGEAVGPNGKYVGVDFSPGLLSIARTRVKNSRMDWVFLKEMDVRKLLPKNRYDAVLMNYLLGYVPSPMDVVKKALDLLNPGGRLLIVDVFRDKNPLSLALEFFESLTPEFVKFPTTSEIIRSVEESYHEAEVRPVGNSVLLVELLE